MTDKATLPINLPPIGISTAILASELPSKGETPKWIKITPRGAATTRDGRDFTFTPETLVSRFNAEGVKLPIDVNHVLSLKASQGEPIGWAKELEARSDGTYAQVDMLPKGKAILEARTHPYVSPTIYHDENGRVTGLHSIALCAAPALSMPEIGATLATLVEGAETIRSALGLDAAASEKDCIAAIATLSTQFVPVGLYADTVAALNNALGTHADLKRNVREHAIDAMLEGALKEGKITPAERSQYRALCSNAAGFAQVSTLMANKPVLGFMRPSGLDGAPAQRTDDETPNELASRAARHRQTQLAAGVEITMADAVAFVHAHPGAAR